MGEFLTSPTGLLIMFLLVFGALGGAVYAYFARQAPERTAGDRLRDVAGDDYVGPKNQDDVIAQRVAERIAALATTNDEDEKKKLRMDLIQAGFTNKNALEVLNATRVVAAVALPVLLVPTVITTLFGSSVIMLGGGTLFLGLAGYIVPSMVVDSRKGARQKALMNAFPDALDLLVSSVEAGLGLDAAFRRIAAEIEGAAPELSAEFQMVNHEISAGVARLDALRHLSDRTGLDEVQALVNMLTQAERFGTSIAKSLRVHSSLTRQKRMSRAEEEAAKVSPKLTVVMILFLMPCLMIVLLGPAAVNIKKNLIDK